MSKKTHRPFEGLTWHQIMIVAMAAQPKLRYPSDRRALSGLLGKRVPPVEMTRGGKLRLTETGEELWPRIQAWRPDLFSGSGRYVTV